MNKFKKGDYVKFKTNNHPDKNNYQPGTPMVGWGFVKESQYSGFVEILCRDTLSDYRAREKDCEHIKNINAFDIIEHVLRNHQKYESLIGTGK